MVLLTLVRNVKASSWNCCCVTYIFYEGIGIFPLVFQHVKTFFFVSENITVAFWYNKNTNSFSTLLCFCEKQITSVLDFGTQVFPGEVLLFLNKKKWYSQYHLDWKERCQKQRIIATENECQLMIIWLRVETRLLYNFRRICARWESNS